MNFLRLHLPELHQALRGALDSFSTFVSYLLGDEVPTAERREAQAAEELGEVAAGRPGGAVEKAAQASPGQEHGGLRGPGDTRRHQEGSSATEQTWGWGEGSSHGSQADRRDIGAWEAAKTSRCQEPGVPLEARKKSEAGSESGRNRSSQTQETQDHNEQEVNRTESLRTWEQEEEEEVRAREPLGGGGVESEWTWQKELGRKAIADGQKVVGDDRELEKAVKEAEEIQGPGAKESGREEEVVRDQQSTQETGAESEDGATLGREESRTTSGGEEAGTTSDVEEAGTTSGGEEAGTTSDVEEAGTTSGGEEAGTTSGGEEARTTSGGEEAGTTLGREKSRTTSGGEEARTTSGGEAGTTSGREEAGTTLGREKSRTTSGGEEADLPGVRETDCGAVPEDRLPEGTGGVRALEKASKGDQEEEVDENREAEVSLFLKQSQALGTEEVEEAAKDQTVGREAAEGQGSDGELGEGCENQADQGGKEAKRRQDSEIRAAQSSLEEALQAQAAQEEESCLAAEAELSQDKVADETKGDADLGATPEPRPEKEFREERHEDEAQMAQEALGVQCGGLEHQVTEGQELELVGGPKTPTKQPEEGQGPKEELRGISCLSKEETERSLQGHPRSVGYGKPDASEAEAWEHQTSKGGERGNAEEEKSGTGKGEVGGAGGPELVLPEVLETVREWKEAKEAGCGAESQELGGWHGADWADARIDQSLGESDARKTEPEEVEATGPWEADRMCGRGWRLEAAELSLQSSEDMWAASLGAQVGEHQAASDARAPGSGEGLKGEAGEAWDGAFGRICDSEGREEAGRGKELVEAAERENRGSKEFGPEGLAEEVTGRNGLAFKAEAGEGEPGAQWMEVRDSAMAEGSYGMDGFTSGSQAERAEGTMATVEVEGLLGGQALLAEEAGVWKTREQGPGSEGQCGDYHPEGEAHTPCDVENVQVTRHWSVEAKEIDPEGLEDTQGQGDPSVHQDAAEAEPGPRDKAAGRAEGDAHGSWSEAMLPGSRLDVSVPRSRVLLSRSSSQRRSRPSFRRTATPEQQEGPSSPVPEKELSVLEQRRVQPEPSPPRPEGTPVPARRRPPGHGFALAHPGMMQELQARLGRPKPQ